MTRQLLTCTALVLSALMVACGGGTQQPVELDGGDDAATGQPASTPTEATATPGDGAADQLPPDVAQAVLGDHLDDWFTWVEMPWNDPFLPRCDQLSGAEEACERARTVADSAQAGQLTVLGPYEAEDLSPGLAIQGLSQLVVVFDDDAGAEELSQEVREVMAGWGVTSRDLSIGDSGWAADHFDTDPGGLGEIDPELATRMVAVRQGRTLVVLIHGDYPDDPRLETEPIAGEIAERLADAE